MQRVVGRCQAKLTRQGIQERRKRQGWMDDTKGKQKSRDGGKEEANEVGQKADGEGQRERARGRRAGCQKGS